MSIDEYADTWAVRLASDQCTCGESFAVCHGADEDRDSSGSTDTDTFYGND